MEVTLEGFESLKTEVTMASGAEIGLRASLSQAKATITVN